MVNMYAYTYPSTMLKYPGFIYTKIGDSHRDVNVRMDEQGGSSEGEAKVVVGTWPDCKVIKRDYDLHKKLKQYHVLGAHKGTEWFKIPGNSVEEARAFIDNAITKLERRKVRKSLVLRPTQQRSLDQALAIISSSNAEASIIANLCPRFGKTVWALALFNEISKRYGNRVMLLPAYWLAVHSSFIGELDEYNDFNDIVQVNVGDGDTQKAGSALKGGKRIVVPLSLHGEPDGWREKHKWLATIPNDEIFMFADEGDFGTHTDSQKEKLDFLFNRGDE